jgi:hypothetical protein
MTENTGFAAFAMYNSFKLHFTSNSYDYFKYHGKTNVTKENFMRRRDKYSFYKLSRKYSLDELKEYFVANFVYGTGTWIGDLLTPEGEDAYKKWQKIQQSLSYTFENDIVYLFDKYGIKSEEIIRVDRGQHPVLLKEVMSGRVNIETLVIMNDLTNFVEQHWQPRIQDDIVWPNWYLKIKKYTPFVMFDKNKFKTILKEKLKEYVEA